ncbi:MAG: hypothetical protein U9Q62_03320 [Campylobacterota bacterium]|nr:hypothetical protein [Campylobacterota bacterium]
MKIDFYHGVLLFNSSFVVENFMLKPLPLYYRIARFKRFFVTVSQQKSSILLPLGTGAVMIVFKKLHKRFKKSDSKTKLEAIYQELQTYQTVLENLLDTESSESKLTEYQKEYKAIRVLQSKTRKCLETNELPRCKQRGIKWF